MVSCAVQQLQLDGGHLLFGLVLCCFCLFVLLWLLVSDPKKIAETDEGVSYLSFLTSSFMVSSLTSMFLVYCELVWGMV